MPSIMLATLCLNEMEWLPRLYEQHKDWPGMVGWVFVEAVDQVYANCNPSLVASGGFSVDDTTEFLQDLSDRDTRVRHLAPGYCSDSNLAQGKVQARQHYLNVANQEFRPDFVFILDADEFYTHQAQAEITQMMADEVKGVTAFMFRQRHIWHPPSVQSSVYQEKRAKDTWQVLDPGYPLFSQEVVGGYWNIPHTRGWRWRKGMEYRRNHNWPEVGGRYLTEHTARFNRVTGNPECVHMGYASALKGRAAKHTYYIARGEGKGDRRQYYVECRAAWEYWKPGDSLPHGAQVKSYSGPIPECFK